MKKRNAKLFEFFHGHKRQQGHVLFLWSFLIIERALQNLFEMSVLHLPITTACHVNEPVQQKEKLGLNSRIMSPHGTRVLQDFLQAQQGKFLFRLLAADGEELSRGEVAFLDEQLRAVFIIDHVRVKDLVQMTVMIPDAPLKILHRPIFFFLGHLTHPELVPKTLILGKKVIFIAYGPFPIVFFHAGVITRHERFVIHETSQKCIHCVLQRC